MPVRLATTSSVFSAALAAMLVAPELQADVVSLTFNPGSVPFGSVGFISMPEVTNIAFLQLNDSFRPMLVIGLSSIAVVQLSQTLSPNTFFGSSVIVFTATSSGTQYVGFRFGNNVGWFSFSVAGLGTDIHYLEGRYGNAGESVHVPAPGALALLALGAVGVRRKRKRAA